MEGHLADATMEGNRATAPHGHYRVLSTPSWVGEGGWRVGGVIAADWPGLLQGGNTHC